MKDADLVHGDTLPMGSDRTTLGLEATATAPRSDTVSAEPGSFQPAVQDGALAPRTRAAHRARRAARHAGVRVAQAARG